MQAQHRQLQSMGTRLDVVIPDVGSELADRVMKQVKSELARIERRLSLYDPDSDIALINAAGHAGHIAIDQELRGIFLEILALNRETGGYFDVTMKPVYDFYRGHGSGSMTVPRKIREIVGLDKISLTHEGIRLCQRGAIIDMGGYGKGFAVKRMLEIFQNSGIERALVSFGESLIYGLGSHPYGDTWKVSLPLEGPGEPVTFDLNDHALSTSGNSLNNRKKFANSGHIVNPVTCQTISTRGLVSVRTRDPTRAEAFSTALFSAGPEYSEQILENVSGMEVRWILPDVFD